MAHLNIRKWVGALALAAVSGLALVACAPKINDMPISVRETAAPNWVTTWATAVQQPAADWTLNAATYPDGVTIRQIIRPSIGADAYRLRLSNVYGQHPVTINAASVAPTATANWPSSGFDVGGQKSVTFNGQTSVTIPAGGGVVSDAIAGQLPPMVPMTVSLFIAQVPASQTGHGGARIHSFFAPGNQLAAATLANQTTATRWYYLDGLDVLGAPHGATIAALGDSITDGRGVRDGFYDRWTDVLAQRLQASPQYRHLGVANLGIGGNCVLRTCIADPALNRFERDVFQPGVKYLIIFEGVNDLGGFWRAQNGQMPSQQARDALVGQLTAAYQTMIERARARGVKVIGATITPYGGGDYYVATPESEAMRQQINDWIRVPGHFDAVIDFDAITRDPSNPSHMQDAYQSDRLHPSPAGFRAMAEGIDLSIFQ